MDTTNYPPPTTLADPPAAAASPLELCQAVMLGLGPRRYVIVRRNAAIGLRSLFPLRRRVRDLRPGDAVIYKGQSVVVRSVEIYE